MDGSAVAMLFSVATVLFVGVIGAVAARDTRRLVRFNQTCLDIAIAYDRKRGTLDPKFMTPDERFARYEPGSWR